MWLQDNSTVFVTLCRCGQGHRLEGVRGVLGECGVEWCGLLCWTPRRPGLLLGTQARQAATVILALALALALTPALALALTLLLPCSLALAVAVDAAAAVRQTAGAC